MTIEAHVAAFLSALASTGRSANTVRAYRTDLAGFACYVDGDLGDLKPEHVGEFLSEIAGLAPATRKRKRAAVAAFCRWAVRHNLLAANPMDKFDTINVANRPPQPAAAGDVVRVLDEICSRRPAKHWSIGLLRDRVLFETIYACGATTEAVCRLEVEDLDLTPNDEHIRLRSRDGATRSVLLDDRGFIALLKRYLARTGYQSGPLFRATINGKGGALTYSAAHHRWQKYAAAADVDIHLHQLRYAHAAELVRAGVAIEVVRQRLGLAYTRSNPGLAQLAEKAADTEIRAARRRPAVSRWRR
ncbi:tyrosine-type recombinase/integrase [Nocardia sp. NPDC055165]